jgi:hypothetical protein
LAGFLLSNEVLRDVVTIMSKLSKTPSFNS